MELNVKQDFKWAHRGVQIEEFAAGDTIDTEDEDLIRVSREEGWATAEGDPDHGKPAPRTKKSAPENKDAGAAPESK